MNQKVCYYCGTKYPLEDECCPLCGQTEVEPEALDETPVELTADVTDEDVKENDRKKSKKGGARSSNPSNVISTIICILLAVAVIAGTVFILNTLGIISFEKQPADDSSLTLPVEEQTSAEVLCAGIDLAPSNAAFNEVGTTVNLIVTIDPAGCTEEVSYQSGDETVATVSDSGVVTAVGSGTTEITVTCGNFAKSMEVVCTIEEEVPEEPVETIEIDPESVSLSTEDFSFFEAGETAKITINGLPEGAQVKWSSSNEAVAIVEDGKVTGTGGGTATVTAAIGETELKCVVRCKFEGTFVPETTETGDTADDSSEEAPFIFPADVTISVDETFDVRLVQNDARIQGVEWSVADGSICTVDANGAVIGQAPGVTEITGLYNGVKYTCIVRCR